MKKMKKTVFFSIIFIVILAISATIWFLSANKSLDEKKQKNSIKINTIQSISPGQNKIEDLSGKNIQIGDQVIIGDGEDKEILTITSIDSNGVPTIEPAPQIEWPIGTSIEINPPMINCDTNCTPLSTKYGNGCKDHDSDGNPWCYINDSKSECVQNDRGLYQGSGGIWKRCILTDNKTYDLTPVEYEKTSKYGYCPVNKNINTGIDFGMDKNKCASICKNNSKNDYKGFSYNNIYDTCKCTDTECSYFDRTGGFFWSMYKFNDSVTPTTTPTPCNI